MNLLCRGKGVVWETYVEGYSLVNSGKDLDNQAVLLKKIRLIFPWFLSKTKDVQEEWSLKKILDGFFLEP